MKLTIENANIQMETMHLWQQLKIVSAALNKFQRDDCTIGECVNIWFDVKEAPVLQPYRDQIEKRFEKCVTAAHLVAYQGHPNIKGKNCPRNKKKKQQNGCPKSVKTFYQF